MRPDLTTSDEFFISLIVLGTQLDFGTLSSVIHCWSNDMSKLQHGSKEDLDAIRLKAISHFAPILLHEALLRLCRACGGDVLARYHKSTMLMIEQSSGNDPDFEDMKEFAIQQLHLCVTDVESSPDMTHPVEDVQNRRTYGRSEKSATLEDQLNEGLESSFPASDPPAVISTAISGRAKPLVGTDEILRQRSQEAKAAK